jgi:hypothetical protein
MDNIQMKSALREIISLNNRNLGRALILILVLTHFADIQTSRVFAKNVVGTADSSDPQVGTIVSDLSHNANAAENNLRLTLRREQLSEFVEIFCAHF